MFTNVEVPFPLASPVSDFLDVCFLLFVASLNVAIGFLTFQCSSLKRRDESGLIRMHEPVLLLPIDAFHGNSS